MGKEGLKKSTDPTTSQTQTKHHRGGNVATKYSLKIGCKEWDMNICVYEIGVGHGSKPKPHVAVIILVVGYGYRAVLFLFSLDHGGQPGSIFF
jgi:hypothetical protein